MVYDQLIEAAEIIIARVRCFRGCLELEYSSASGRSVSLERVPPQMIALDSIQLTIIVTRSV